MELPKKTNEPNEMYGTIKRALNRQYRGDKFHGNEDIVTATQSANCGHYNRNNYKEQKIKGRNFSSLYLDM
jgi:hypothetical protein